VSRRGTDIRAAATEDTLMAELNRSFSNRHERRAAVLEAPPNRVQSLQRTAQLSNISLATLRRRIKDGTGPRVTAMSPRRRGVTDRHREAWLESCAERADEQASRSSDS
jgi:uncharacterized protein (DUF2342 family)